MSLDTLLKLLPNSSWVVLIAVVVIVFLLIERVTNFSTSVADRRNDKQLLEQADLAASILEKLPDGHRDRSDLLTYISHGPVAELSERHNNRVARKKTAAKRQSRIWYMVGSFGILGLAFFPYLPAYYSEMLSSKDPDLQGVPITLRIILVTVPFFLYYGILSMIVYAIVASMNYFAELGTNGLRKLRMRRVQRRQELKGHGGVYEI